MAPYIIIFMRLSGPPFATLSDAEKCEEKIIKYFYNKNYAELYGCFFFGSIGFVVSLRYVPRFEVSVLINYPKSRAK